MRRVISLIKKDFMKIVNMKKYETLEPELRRTFNWNKEKFRNRTQMK